MLYGLYALLRLHFAKEEEVYLPILDQIHRWDNTTPIEETMEVLDEVVESGRARYIGASSMYAWQFSKAQCIAQSHGWAHFISMQNHYNLVYREEEREMIPLCIDRGIGIIPWSPLARRFLAGNRKRGRGGETVRAGNDPDGDNLYFREEDFAVAERVSQIANERGAASAQIALAWLLNKPFITAPIMGVTRMEHLNQAIAALDIRLTDDEIKRLEEPYKPHAILGHSQEVSGLLKKVPVCIRRGRSGPEMSLVCAVARDRLCASHGIHQLRARCKDELPSEWCSERFGR